jgi:hypothetical protein
MRLLLLLPDHANGRLIMTRIPTRKTVTLMVTATFEGTYYEAQECSGVLSTWITDACEDRDDLRGVAVVGHHTVEEPVDDREELARQLATAREEAHTSEMALLALGKKEYLATRRIWQWIVDANNGAGADRDDLIGILDGSGLPCPPELREDES